AVTLTLGLSITLFAFSRLSRSKDGGERSGSGLGFDRNRSLYSKELRFGHGSGGVGRDSRYWDKDDRRRDQDYDEEDVLGHKIEKIDKNIGVVSEKVRGKSGSGSGGLYNEGGRKELDSYNEKYEASLAGEDVGLDDEYDDGIDVQDDHDDEEHEHEHDDADGDGGGRKLGNVDGEEHHEDMKVNVEENDSSEAAISGNGSGSRNKGDKGSGSKKSSKSKKKPRHHRSPGSSCEMKFLNSTEQLIEPLENKKFSRFSLQYTQVEGRPSGASNWEPRFAGHMTPQEREDSFYARDQRINCGFIKGPKGYSSTGFDLAEDDVKYMSSCHIAVSSCIFGNSDHLRSPYYKVITRQSRKSVCFVMFMDESTLQTLASEGQKMDSMGFIGLWRIVVVKNLPSSDMRRVGKIPKLLTHRLFPSARYSIWLDSKLRLQNDPYLILEYFLWRKGHEYAISNHYDRHCVWEEVAQNKKLNKYNYTVIDEQFEFYRADGLTRFDPSDPKKLLPSYVPEGSFIVRAHTPMSNLFSCLWYNEVDHFTPRDQLSFAYTYLKLRRMNPGKTFHLNMFKDCERRKIAKLFRHRAEDKRNLLTQSLR
ncbi:uncharacterized protein LOC109824180, partial [Asparagus officinalis]